MLEAEVIRSLDESTLKDIIEINNESFSPCWIYPDQEIYYRDMLRQKNNIHVFLKHGDKRVGYLLAIPHDVAVAELINDDPMMKNDPTKYYIETAGIIPEYRGKSGLTIMMKRLVAECINKGITKLSMHARVNTGLSNIMQSMFKVAEVRRIESWPYYSFEEPTDYIEVILEVSSQ
jgi:ribosomal protein S18 acetylase RimI-like enzyme